MSIVSYIVIALALGLNSMLLFRRCGEATPVRLSAGLLTVIGVSIIHVFLYYIGCIAGRWLCFYSADDPQMYSDLNAYIFLGMTIIVLLKVLVPYLRRNPQLPVFSLKDSKSVLALAFATGINVLLMGIGVGFADNTINPIHKILWPLLIANILLGYLGLMFGRQKVQLRPRRWAIVSCILLLGVAIAAVVNAGGR